MYEILGEAVAFYQLKRHVGQKVRSGAAEWKTIGGSDKAASFYILDHVYSWVMKHFKDCILKY